MAIVGLDHVNISTCRLAETRAFFIDVLGLTEGWRPELPFGGAWLYQGDRAVVHLVEKDEALAPFREAGLDHFAFEIADYEGMVARLKAHGVEFVANQPPGTRIRQIFLQDVNDITIELNYPG